MGEEQASTKMSREIGTADILSQAFHIYSRSFLSYFLPFLIIGSVSTILSYAIDLGTYTQRLTDFTVSGMFTIIFSFITSNIANGLVIKLTSEIYTRGKGDLSSSFNHAMQRILSLLIGSLLFAIAVGIGIVLFVVPGIIIFIMFCLVNQFIMLENKGPISAFSSSRALVYRNWRKVMYLTLFLSLIIFVTSFFGDLFTGYIGDLGSQIIGQIVSSLTQPLWPISFTLLYYYLKSRKGEETQTI